MLKICRKPFIPGQLLTAFGNKSTIKSVIGRGVDGADAQRKQDVRKPSDQSSKRGIRVCDKRAGTFFFFDSPLPTVRGIEFRFLFLGVVLKCSTVDSDSWMLFYRQSSKCLCSPANQWCAATCLCTTVFSSRHGCLDKLGNSPAEE